MVLSITSYFLHFLKLICGDFEALIDVDFLGSFWGGGILGLKRGGSLARKVRVNFNFNSCSAHDD